MYHWAKHIYSKMNRRDFLKIGTVGVFSTALYSYTEPIMMMDISNVRIPFKFNIKALHITDSHLHHFGYFEKDMMEKIGRESRYVDLIFLTGDIYDKYTPDLNMFEEFLNYLNGFKIGIFGNHEHYAENKYDLHHVRKIYERYDSTILVNELIEYKGIRIGGIDWYWDETDIGDKYLDSIGKIDILLAHTPDAYRLPANTAKLTLAGHTHGGQICIPLIGPLWIPSRYGTKYASGLFLEDYKYLYVNRGIGEFYFLPFRFNCRREVAILFL